MDRLVKQTNENSELVKNQKEAIDSMKVWDNLFRAAYETSHPEEFTEDTETTSNRKVPPQRKKKNQKT